MPNSDSETRHSLMVLMFTDIVGSTALKTDFGGQMYRRIVAKHDDIFRATITSIPGAECLKDTGDGFLARFATATDATKAALLFQHALATDEWEHRPMVRVGIHVGEVEEVPNDISGLPKLVGLAVDMTARIMSLAQPGQILLTQTAYDSARQYVREHPAVEGELPQIEWHDHGSYLFHGSPEAMAIFEVGAIGAPLSAPPNAEKARRVVSGKASRSKKGRKKAAASSAHAAAPQSTEDRSAAPLVFALLLLLLGGGALWWFTRNPDPSTETAGATADPADVNKHRDAAKDNPPTNPPEGTELPKGTVNPPEGTKPPEGTVKPPEGTKPPEVTVKPPEGTKPPSPKRAGIIVTGVDLLDAINEQAKISLTMKTGEAKVDYVDGENITFTLETDRDCFITLFTIDSAGELTLLAPNAWQRQIRATGGEKMTIPSPNAAFAFPIGPPHGPTYIKAIATLRPLALEQLDTARFDREKFIGLGNTKSLDGRNRIKALTANKSLKEMFKVNEWVTAELAIDISAKSK